MIFWVPPIGSVLKFNVDGAAWRNPGQVGIGVLHNSKGIVLALFSKHVDCIESNEAEDLAILEAIWVFSSSFF